MLRIADSLPALLGAISLPPFLVYAGIVLLLGIFAGSCWIVYGRGPRRRRSYRRILNLMNENAWAEALENVQRLQGLGLLSPLWQSRVLASQVGQRSLFSVRYYNPPVPQPISKRR